jgi:uncharacterized protein (DUF4415 family)
MLELLTLEVLKAVTSTCVKFYIAALLGGGGRITYDKTELGYKVPKWFMNPDSSVSALCGYGTSVQGDEFQSLDSAKDLATEQMAKTIRISTRAMVEEKIRYDRTSAQQKRLVEVLVKSEGLEDFIRANATVSRKQLVEVTKPEKDMRAFVELQLDAKVYGKYREDTLQTAKKRILMMKTDDLIAEMEADEALLGTPTNAIGTAVQPPPQPPAPPAATPALPPAGAKPTPPTPSAVEKELDSMSATPGGSSSGKTSGFKGIEQELESEGTK